MPILHRNIQATLGIFQRLTQNGLIQLRAAINKLFFTRQCVNNIPKKCLMRPVRGRNCHTQFQAWSTTLNVSMSSSIFLFLFTISLHSLSPQLVFFIPWYISNSIWVLVDQAWNHNDSTHCEQGISPKNQNFFNSFWVTRRSIVC